jgi:hypothetical protein
LIEYRQSVKAVLEPVNTCFVLYWTRKLLLDTSAWTAFQEGGMRTQIKSLAQVACLKFIRQWGTSGMHADIKHGEVSDLMTFSRPTRAGGSLTALRLSN